MADSAPLDSLFIVTPHSNRVWSAHGTWSSQCGIEGAQTIQYEKLCLPECLLDDYSDDKRSQLLNSVWRGTNSHGSTKLLVYHSATLVI